MTRSRKEQLTITLSPEATRWLKDLAALSGQSVSATIEGIIAQMIRMARELPEGRERP